MPDSRTCAEIESLFSINKKEKKRLEDEIARLKSVISSQEKLDDQIRRQAAKATMLEDRFSESEVNKSMSQIGKGVRKNFAEEIGHRFCFSFHFVAETLKAKERETSRKCEEMELFVELIRARLESPESLNLESIIEKFRQGKYGDKVNGDGRPLVNGVTDSESGILESQTMVHDLELKMKQVYEPYRT